MSRPRAAARSTAMLAMLVAGCTALSSCAFGDYMAHGPCEDYSGEVASVIEASTGEPPEAGDIWADGAGTPLCILPFSLDQPHDSESVDGLHKAVQRLISGWSDQVIIEITIGSQEAVELTNMPPAEN